MYSSPVKTQNIPNYLILIQPIFSTSSAFTFLHLANCHFYLSQGSALSPHSSPAEAFLVKATVCTGAHLGQVATLHLMFAAVIPRT